MACWPGFCCRIGCHGSAGWAVPGGAGASRGASFVWAGAAATTPSAIFLLAGAGLAGPAAVLTATATALAALAPMLALRLGKLPLPRVPADIDSFRAEEEPTLGPDVLDQTATAERILTGLLAALA